MSKSTRGLIALVSGFAALGFGLLALFYWAAIVTPAFSFTNIDWTLKILAIAAIICLAIYLLTSPDSVGTTMGKRSTRLTANALIATIVAIAIGVVVNIIVDNVQAVRGDWTAGKDFSISPQTVKVLNDLDASNKTVTALGFFVNQRSQTAQDLLNEYHANTARFRFELVDPNTAPLRAKEYGVVQDGTVVFTDGKKRELVKTVGEREFTSAISRLFDSGTKTVAFLTGHGERDINGADQPGYSSANQSLQLDNYTTVKWNLATSPTLGTKDVTVLVIAEPISPLGAKDQQAVQAYMDAGGHALILLDPAMKPEVLASLTPILSKYGVTPHQGVVIDLSKALSAQDASSFRVDKYQGSPITDDLGTNGLPTAFFAAMAVTPPTSTLTTTVATTLIQTSGGPPTSWLETNLNPSTPIQYDAGADLAGPVSIGVSVGPTDSTDTVTNTNTVKSRLVIFGDADFPSNLFLSTSSQVYLPTNGDLFANSVSWLAGANELVSIRKKDPAAPRTLVLDNGQKNVQLITAVFGLPLFVLLLGGAIWWRRK